MGSRNHVSDLGSCRLPYGDIKRPMIYRVKGVGKQQEPQRPFPPVRPRPAKGYETGRKEGLECRISCRIVPFVSLVTRGTIASRSRNGRERKNNNESYSTGILPCDTIPVQGEPGNGDRVEKLERLCLDLL